MDSGITAKGNNIISHAAPLGGENDKALDVPHNDFGDLMPRARSEENMTLFLRQAPDGYTEPSSPSLSRPTSARFRYNTFWQFRWSWLLLLGCIAWVVFTICFAYNCTLANPFSASLLFSRPENTLLMLNILSHGTIILLKELTSSVFETVRWAFACSKKGILARSFIGLSRATNTLGVLSLVFGGFTLQVLKIDGYRLWGSQRIFFTILHAFVGIALLTNVSFITSWHNIRELSFEGAGLGRINSSIALQPIVFWAWFYGIVVSPNYITTIPPTQCSGGLCVSQFLPGPCPLNGSQLSGNQEATAIVVSNLTGYQLEFYPPNDPDELNGAACKAYGVDSVAILICLKQSGNNLLAGFPVEKISLTAVLNACPYSSNCLSNTSWQANVTYYTNITISKRQATVVYSSINNTILDVPTIDTPIPAIYDPAADFFPIYNRAMDTTLSSVTIDYITTVATQVLFGDVYTVQALLKQLIAVPVGLYNDPVSLGIYPTENQYVSGYLGNPTYRITISSVSLYAFVAGAVLSLIWSIVVLLACMHVQFPNSSLYPEINFASKCVDFGVEQGQSPLSMTELLHPLSDSDSRDVRTRLSRRRFYVSTEFGHLAFKLEKPSGDPGREGHYT